MSENYIYSKESIITVNREWLRLIHTLLLFSDNTIFWLKLDSNKIYIDHSNNNDVIVKYKNGRELAGENKKKNQEADELKNYHEKTKNKQADSDDIIILPFNKVKLCNDKMGIIMCSKHALIIPKIIDLGRSYTIFFRFYVPIISTKNDHVLIQDKSGQGGLIVITKDRKGLGSYNLNGEFINSGINLEDRRLQHRWLSFALSYYEMESFTKISYFFEGNLVKSYDKESYKLTRNIAYIGNSSDYNHPFGVFCDLRIYPSALDLDGYRRLIRLQDESVKNDKNDYSYISNINKKFIDKIKKNFLENFAKGNPQKSNDFDNSEESFSFLIKILNCTLILKENRSKFIDYKLLFKIMEFLSSSSVEVKKDISKFLNTLS